MATTTVRISEETRNLLKDTAEKTGASMSTVLDAAVRSFARKVFWEKAYADFEAIRNDPQAWKEEQEEFALWETTVGDGLEDD
ncbi:toxin-antitoxin system protein [bacterium]|nr:toxin-antitoxin system protein [bacterium]